MAFATYIENQRKKDGTGCEHLKEGYLPANRLGTTIAKRTTPKNYFAD